MIMNDVQPMISVVVFSYNHKEHIRKCLDSILRQQTGFSYEILLADDASPDGTAQIVWEQYGDSVRVLDRAENLGLCRNIYDAFMQANGKYIYECSGDDYLPTDQVFEKLAGFLETHDDFFSVNGWVEFYNVATGTKKVNSVSYDEYTILDFLRGVVMPTYMGMIRNTFKEDRPDYLCKAGRNNEEMQMCYYVLMKGKKKILPERLYTYCYRTNSSESNYNARLDYLQLLQDYALGFCAVGQVDAGRHRFDVAKVTYYSGSIDRHIQNNGLKSVLDIAKVLGFRDTISFVWIKLLMRLNHRQMPRFLLEKRRLEQEVSVWKKERC